jgi:Zn-dependent metalloprotease
LHFISVEPQLFGWTPELELQLTSRRRGIGTEHVRFQALFSGVPISGSELAFHLDRPTAGSSQLHFLTARLYPDTASLRAEDLTPRFSSRQAIDTAEAAVNLRAALPQESKARLEILPVPPPGRLVYVVRVASRDPHGVFRVRVDARHGDVLSVGDVLRYGPQNPTDGSGQVFLSNPIVALKDKTLTDDDNSAEAVPLEAYSEVTLRDLDGLGGLTGPYVTTENTPRAVRRVSLLFSAG